MSLGATYYVRWSGLRGGGGDGVVGWVLPFFAFFCEGEDDRGEFALFLVCPWPLHKIHFSHHQASC